MRIKTYFALLLCLNFISIIQMKLSEERIPIHFELGDTVEFNMKKNYFKFDYENINSSTAIFYFENYAEVNLTYPNGSSEKIYLEKKICEINLEENGTYYMELKCASVLCFFGDYFTSFINGNIKEIDLSQNIYLNNIRFETNEDYNLYQYKVSNIENDTYVYFYHEMLRYNYDKDYTFFEICDEGKNCTKNVQIYKFEKNNTYMIY